MDAKSNVPVGGREISALVLLVLLTTVIVVLHTKTKRQYDVLL